MLHLLHRISYVCTVLSCFGNDNLRRRALGVAFLKPGSNSTRPPPAPPGGSYTIYTRRIFSQSGVFGMLDVRSEGDDSAIVGVIGVIARQLTLVVLVSSAIVS